MKKLTITIPTGRLKDEVLGLLSCLLPTSFTIPSRQLVIDDASLPWRVILSHPKDVATYVEHGAADLGCVGKDILLERGNEVYELLDLRIGKCVMVLAGPEGTTKEDLLRREYLRIATKYPHFTLQYLQERRIHADIVALYGSIELAPAIGIADGIVDLVSTGKTLRENRLHVLEAIVPISTRLVANRVSMKTKTKEIEEFTRALEEVIPREDHPETG
ncbi:MAG: ATP phosphoribosyltransferase [Candidatus Caldatribacterium sp.]|uniref:ATP phosphoribosyltransferase n=1 Tax=Candidatus Caldatribacterium sp. TaxID=2282143 RepID=UPI00299A6250|nr:ATP phosphoribosyltransferase [Candidatus Caldatribacterium sp.]MCX7731514.1 ATP phosphoribosyltransferase [Candidatus Caldatribacterium sp.]MDW8080549.1 ATP phosphoribosyltransferase [Candidatus Calescibacterium sp.]